MSASYSLLFLTALLDDGDAAEYFTYMYQNYRGIMYDYAFSVLGCRERAEDAVQDTFLKLAARDEMIPAMMEKGHDPREKFFMADMARQRAIDMVRSNEMKAVSYDDGLAAEAASHDEYPCLSEDTAELSRAIDRLPGDYREIIMLLYYRDFSADQATRILGLDKRNFYVKKSRALKRLRQLVNEEMDA